MRRHDFTVDTEKYLVKVEAYLIKRYGQINEEWTGVIELLGDTLDMYNECRQVVKEVGLYNPENGRKNPLISTIKECQATIMKLYQHLGISPYAASKIKQIEEDDSNLLSAIMGQDE